MKSAFELIEKDPAKVALLIKRSDLMNEIRDLMDSKKITQNKAAEKIGCSQARVSRLVCGNISDFSYDWLFVAKHKLENK